MGLKIALLTNDNGVGLSLDVELLTDLFESAGHQVSFVPWKSRTMELADAAFHLELVSVTLAKRAHRNVLVPNMEWYPREWLRYIPAFDQIWAKGWDAHNTCVRHGSRTTYMTGFLGKDRMDRSVPRRLECLHIRGKSDMKGTMQVLEAWRAHPDLPPLTVVSRDDMPVPYGVRLVVSPSVEELDTLINQAEIHVCPSRAEGWGHYITEAMSAEAVVVTTNGSPMNEHIRPGWGFLIDAPTGPSKHHQSHLLLAGPDSIAEAVRRAASLAPEDRSEMGRLARRHFLVRNHAFRDTALELLEKL